MTFIPEFYFGLKGGWWFSLIYIIANLAMVFLYPGTMKRLKTPAKLRRTLVEKINHGLILTSMWGTILLASVLPLKPGFQGFFTGIALFASGIVLTMVSLWNYAATGTDEPVVTGFYRLSRNPIYVAYTIIWYGAALSLGSWLLILFHTVEIVACHFLVLDEERFCQVKYGESYASYQDRVPRYIWKI